MSGPDIDDALKNDVQKVKDLSTGSTSTSPPKIIESVFWTLAILSVILMLASMPWVGPGRPIPGQAWLALSLLGILVFSALGALTRVFFGRIGSQMDDQLSKQFENR